MSWTEFPAWRLRRRLFSAAWLALTACLSMSAFAGDERRAAEAAGNATPEAWLVTYGPGELYWQRFGHNAIWIRDPGLALDHTFNFGFFDFRQERFFLRFLQGRMLYFSAARPAQDEFAAYISENRSIRAQKLQLDPGRQQDLTTFLLREARPENRDYLYDYYRNNCSTRVRDALDMALNGALKSRFGAQPSPLNWREHTRRLTAADFWLHLGLEIGLGSPVDRAISRWDEMFIPGELAEAVSEMSAGPSGSGPLVVEDAVLYRSSFAPPPVHAPALWPRYLAASAAVLLLAGIVSRWMPASIQARGWLTLGGLAGAALLFFWFGTDHAVARLNLNLLLFNPLWILLAWWRGRERLAWWVMVTFSALALVMPWLPPWQYNLNVLAAFLPLNLAAAWVLRRSAPSRAA